MYFWLPTSSIEIKDSLIFVAVYFRILVLTVSFTGCERAVSSPVQACVRRWLRPVPFPLNGPRPGYEFD
jgi:hypothetical protein